MQKKWNDIVKFYNKNKFSSEEQIQQMWELIFSECFEYSRLNGEIDRHRSLQIGSMERVIPDIILKKDNRDLFIVELKKHNYSFKVEFEKQLFSYLKQIRCDIGVLICDKIYIYYFDYQKNDEEQLKCCIDFEEDNEDGFRLLKLFSKNTFNKKEIKGFIEEKNQSENIKKEIQKELTEEFVKEIVKDFFYKIYGKQETDNALSDYNFFVETKTESRVSENFPINSLININDNKVGKIDSIRMINKKGYSKVNSKNTTYACNHSQAYYPSNINISRFSEDFYLILDDSKRRVCYYMKIPANTFSRDNFRIRSDKDSAIVYLKYNDPRFSEMYSNISFERFIFETLSY